MNDLTRREFLKFIGATGAVASVGTLATLREARAAGLWFTPVRIPSPLPIYAAAPSWLASGLNGAGAELPPDPTPELASYTVIDDVIVPPEYERYVIVQWGDRVYPNKDDYFGFNCDHTGYAPLHGRHDGFLVVNHEYTSYPFHQLSPGTNTGFGAADASAGNRTFESGTGLALPSKANLFDLTPDEKRHLYGEQCYNVGLSVVRVRRRDHRGHLLPVWGDWRNRRVHLLSGLALNKERKDAYGAVTSWGPSAHEQGDANYLVGTGPAAADVFEKLSTDGLGRRIIGTGYNCSGGVTPWGTAFAAEENFQGGIARFASGPNSGKVDVANSFYIGVQEAVKPNGTQTAYVAETAGAEFGLVGEKYGWMVEIDPRNPRSRVKKHTALGRFRHENIAVRAERGSPLVAYMGDDRRGGHWWKFVSKGTIRRRRDPRNSELFEAGRLYVARFHADGAGEWIPLELATATNPNDPTVLSQPQFDQQGARDRNGLVKLPLRLGTPPASGAGFTTVTPADGGFANVDTTNQKIVLPYYQGKALSDFYTSQGAALCDAFAAANLVGGTPCARPEDCEVHPRTKAVYLTHTDAAAGSDGYPDSRIFTVAKYKADATAAQQSGDILKLVEESADASGLSFTWTRFSKAGEVGTKPDGTGAAGMGYANVDNLAFDRLANLWGVTDMSTGLHNGVGDGPTPSNLTINHAGVGSGGSAGGNLVGVFGNNWLFFVPTAGGHAGTLFPFAIGPTRSEMTGPTFVGNTLILAVQHPGEDSPARAKAAATVTRTIELLKSDGSGALVAQSRTVPAGSQWPGNVGKSPTDVARPAVIGIQRKRRTWREHWEDDADEDHDDD
jgi:secreted PhoX family phosphatase